MEQTENAGDAQSDAKSERKAEFNHQMKMRFWSMVLSTLGMILVSVGSHAAIKKYDEHF